MLVSETPPPHLFISYAVEGLILAKWFARKLAAQGFAVWFDQMRLPGGEPWPQDIDHGIYTGRLVPQDPSEEPATELLDWLRAERSTSGASPERKTEHKKRGQTATH